LFKKNKVAYHEKTFQVENVKCDGCTNTLKKLSNDFGCVDVDLLVQQKVTAVFFNLLL